MAVVGSGVDDSSGDLAGRLTLGPREFSIGGAGRDCVGHGTFLASLIAARAQQGIGFAGIAPQAHILAVAVTDDAGATTAALLAKGIRAAATAGAQIIDVADSVPAADATLASAVDFAVSKGALVIAPAGADDQQQPGAAYPAAYPNVLAITDVGPGGALPQAAAAATAQPSPATSGTPDSKRVDLAAPGDSVLGIGPSDSGEYTGSGPSFAAAFAAGTAALVLSYRPSLTAAQLTKQLETTAYHPGTTLPDPQFGYGTIDPVAAVSATPPDGSSQMPSTQRAPDMRMPSPPDRTGQSESLAITGLALLTVLVVALLSVIIPRGRRRDWHAGP